MPPLDPRSVLVSPSVVGLPPTGDDAPTCALSLGIEVFAHGGTLHITMGRHRYTARPGKWVRTPPPDATDWLERPITRHRRPKEDFR